MKGDTCMKYYVIKRDGRKVCFDHSKIVNAISRSAKDDNVIVDVEHIATSVENRIKDNYINEITVEEIQDLIEDTLMDLQLEEIKDSSLIVHVVDASSPYMDLQIETTRQVLEELDTLNIPSIFVFNKVGTRLEKELITNGDKSIIDHRNSNFELEQPLEYYQVRATQQGFIPNLTILDLIFNMGPETPLVLKKIIDLNHQSI